MNDATGVTTEKVGLTAERETALITLVGKARQSASADPILPDPWAEAAVERVLMPQGCGRRASASSWPIGPCDRPRPPPAGRP